MKKKTVIIFPGIGYTCKRPLLYYTASLAEDRGWNVIRLSYGEDIHGIQSRDSNDMTALTEKAVERSLEQLKTAELEKSKEIVMVSKSIGTVIAVKTAGKLNLPVRHFMITPIPGTIPLLKEIDGIFLSGTEDPYITRQEVMEAAKKYPEKTGKIFKDCNHSLEKKGDTEGNLENVKKVLKILDKFLREKKEPHKKMKNGKKKDKK